VKPALVVEVRFSNWTDERLLRHPAYQGLREDKPAAEVVHAEPISLKEVKVMAEKSPAAPRRSTRPQRVTARGPAGGTKVSTGNEEVAGVRLSHPDKVLYPKQGITKRDLAAYYARVADWMLPHVVDRPLALVRCPSGSESPCFFQKHPGGGASEYLRQVNVAASGSPEYHVAVADLAGLITLVQMGVLEIHVWGSRAEQLEKPDRLIFDLDPDPAVDWQTLCAAAREVRGVLEALGLTAFLKTTGGKGLHLVVPVRPRVEWEEAKAFCRSVADLMVRAAPDRYIATMSKAARKGKIFVDYLRNGRGATAIAPYSTRARAAATVSAPIAWEELRPSFRSDHFTIENLPVRLSRLKKDPWADVSKTKQSITAAMIKHLKKLNDLS
jgi:bifunctional non-homologous end joining protein LigD